MASIWREKMIFAIIGLLLVSFSFLSAEATENESNEDNVPGRKLLGNYIGYGAIGKENLHRPPGQIMPPPGNVYSRGCSRSTRCEHSQAIMDGKRKEKA